MTNSSTCYTCSFEEHIKKVFFENISNTKWIMEMDFLNNENPSEDLPVPKLEPGQTRGQSGWLEQSWYHGRLLPIVMPLLIALAVLNNLLVLAVTAFSSYFRKRTFASTRLLIGALACCDIGIVLFVRVPLVIGM